VKKEKNSKTNIYEEIINNLEKKVEEQKRE